MFELSMVATMFSDAQVEQNTGCIAGVVAMVTACIVSLKMLK